MRQHIIRSAAFFNPLSTQNYYTMFYTSVKHFYGKLNSLGQFPEPFNFRFFSAFLRRYREHSSLLQRRYLKYQIEIIGQLNASGAVSIRT